MAQNMVGKKPASPYKATKLWNQLLSSFKEGMELKKKRWRLKTYDQCFSGIEALDWMHTYLQNSPAFDSHVTREQAFSLLQKFLENNIFESVLGKSYKRFQDTNFLYHFVDTNDSAKTDKENVTNQNSITNVLKYFGRKNSHSISCENLSSSDNNKGSELYKQNKKITTTVRKPLSEVNSTKTYSDMSTILFDASDEESFDIFNSSISQSNFMRSNSLRFSKKSKKVPLLFKKEEETLVQAKEVETKKLCMSKRLITKELLMSTSSLRSDFSQLSSNPDSQEPLGAACSPSKKIKIDKAITNNNVSQVRAKRERSLFKSIPNKAVTLLGEKQSFINAIDNSSVIKNLPGYKPLETNPQAKHPEVSKLTKVGLKSQNQNEKSVSNKFPTKKEISIKQNMRKPSRGSTMNVSSCGSSNSISKITSPMLASISPKKLNEKSQRTFRRSMSQNDIKKINLTAQKIEKSPENCFKLVSPLKRKRCESVIEHSNQILNKKKVIKSSKHLLHKAPSTWSLNEVGLRKEGDANIEVHETEAVTPLDMERTWKSVVLLSLKKLLHVEKLTGYLDEDLVSGHMIMQNIEIKNDNESKDAPTWLQSAMSCLMNWPQSYQRLKDTQNSFIKHEKLERDVFRTIKEHYEKSLTEPLFPFHFFGLLQECEVMLHEDTKTVIKILQHTLLLLPNWNRCQLHLVVNFMKKIIENDSLKLSADIPNKDLVLHSFYRLIARKEKSSMNKIYEDVVAIRITTFLIEHYEEIFMLPTGLRVQVDHKIAVTLGTKKCESFLPSISKTTNNGKHTKLHATRSLQRTPSYCLRISMQQYEKEAAELSRKAVHELLLSTVNDKSISEKDKTKWLKQFEKSYPDIYFEYIHGGERLPKTAASSQT